MAQVDTGAESAPAESAGESNYLAALQADADASFAALEDAPQPSTEATISAPADDSTESVDPVAEAPALDTVEAELAGNDDEQITRRNARELVEKARAAEREAIEKAAKAEQDAKQFQETQAQHQARMEELANTWGDAGTQSRRLESALARNDWATIDEISERFGFTINNSEDGRAALERLDEQHKRNGEIADYWRQAFIGGTGQIMKKLHETKEGLDLSILMGGDPEKAWTHLYDAGAASKQGRIDALEAENKALRAKAGALSPSPESGGQGSSGGAIPKTVAELERMDLKDFDKNFDKILASIPNR